jgi:transcriptional regulator with XRE-family HTH domain
MTTSDEQIGKNLARLRGEMSQKDLASAMKAKGWKWSQSTVWNIERGERPLRLAEAEDLSLVLQVYGASEFTRADEHARAMSWLHEVNARSEALREAIREHYQAQFQLAVAADEAEKAGARLHPLIEDAIRESATTFEQQIITEDEITGKYEEQAWTEILGSSPDDVEPEQLTGRYLDLYHERIADKVRTGPGSDNG